MDQDNAAKTGTELFDSPRSREKGGDNTCSTPTIKKYSNGWKLEEISHVFIPESVKKRTKSRANKRLSRQNSLKESKVSLWNRIIMKFIKISVSYLLGASCWSSLQILQFVQVLMVTEMRRTESTIQPELFQFNSHFEFLSLIGQTRTSEVFRVRHRFTGELFAVKRSRQRFRSKLERERCLREIVSVSDLPPHPNIVGQYRAWQEDGLFYIQMDLCEGGTLMDFVRNFEIEPIPDTTIWQIAVDIATGLEFLHSNNVLHLDIKPDNIYRGTDEKGQYGPWQIGDFGLAVAKQSAHWEEGDGDYVAPELLKHRGEPSSSADIFSFGATLYECATKTKLPKSPASKTHDFLQKTGRSELLMTLIRAMTLSEANARPSASQVKSYALACLEGFQLQDMSPEEYLVNHSQLANLPTNKQRMQTSLPGHSRWLPSLSPLPSEGALTPGAAAGLVGLTPSTKDNDDENSATKSPNLNAQGNNKSKQASQIQLPLPTNEQLAIARKTNETSWSSFQIRKLDSQSNAVEFPCSASESISFGTGSISDLEFSDLSPPTSNGGDNKWFENLPITTQMQKSPDLVTNSNPILDEELNRVNER